MNRGGLNIDYAEGFKLEEKGFKLYKNDIKRLLNAEYLELTTRSLVDKATGIDCWAEIQGSIVGVSLRVRSKDYDSFTLNRNIKDKYSEINKWLKDRNETIKPTYHLQFAPFLEGLKVFRINIDAFSQFIVSKIESNELFSYYNEKMRCYEFVRSEVSGVLGVSVFYIDGELIFKLG